MLNIIYPSLFPRKIFTSNKNFHYMINNILKMRDENKLAFKFIPSPSFLPPSFVVQQIQIQST